MPTPAHRRVIALLLALALAGFWFADVSATPPLRNGDAVGTTTPEATETTTAPSQSDWLAETPEPAPVVTDAAERPKLEPRPYTAAAQATAEATATKRAKSSARRASGAALDTESATEGPTQVPTFTGSPVEVPLPDGTVRLDDPVLRWLPEMVAASQATGTPLTVIAGVMRLESSGDPNIISVAGARGLMQVMPFHFQERGIPAQYWHDPATNIMVGASILAGNAAGTSWAQAVAAYFGYGCDAYGTCTATYVAVVFGWAAYYAPILTDLVGSGFAFLPSGWLPPEIHPYVEAAPAPIATPPATPTKPKPTATKTTTTTADPTKTKTPTDPAPVVKTPAPTPVTPVNPVPTDPPATEPPATNPGTPDPGTIEQPPAEPPATDPPATDPVPTDPPTEETDAATTGADSAPVPDVGQDGTPTAGG
jgi:hypothetical protein